VGGPPWSAPRRRWVADRARPRVDPVGPGGRPGPAGTSAVAAAWESSTWSRWWSVIRWIGGWGVAPAWARC